MLKKAQNEKEKRFSRKGEKIEPKDK